MNDENRFVCRKFDLHTCAELSANMNTKCKEIIKIKLDLKGPYQFTILRAINV